MQNLRAVYDRNGSKMVDKEGGVGMEDAAGFFANVFGGERFRDYVRSRRLLRANFLTISLAFPSPLADW